MSMEPGTIGTGVEAVPTSRPGSPSHSPSHRSGVGASLAPVALAVIAGAALSLQARTNGTLTSHLGSAVMATLISFLVGTVVLLIICGALGLGRETSGQMRQLWTAGFGLMQVARLTGGLLGVFQIVSISFGVPLIGVALVTVFTVVGQMGAGLVIDAAGMGPMGRQPITALRTVGGVLAIAGLALGTLERTGAHQTSAHTVALLLMLLVAAGVASALQQAANGQLARAVGDPLVAALVCFVTGSIALAALVAILASVGSLKVLTWPTGPSGWWLYTGGIEGAFFVALTAYLVRQISVLEVSLAAVTGQLAGALVLDWMWPSNGQRPGLATVASVVAVALSTIVITMLPRSATRPRRGGPRDEKRGGRESVR